MILLRMALLIMFTTSLGVTFGAFELLLPTETVKESGHRIAQHDDTSQLPAPLKVAESETEELEKLDETSDIDAATGESTGGTPRTVRDSLYCCDHSSQRAGEESHFCLPPPQHI